MPTLEAREEEEFDPDTMVAVDPSRLARLRSSDSLKQYLSHTKLKKVILSIAAPRSSRDRRKNLKKQLDLDADFRGFVDLMLEELGYL